MTSNSKIISNIFVPIEKFLLKNNWRFSHDHNQAKFYVPSEDIGLDSNFSIAIPYNSENTSRSNLFYETVRVLENIYGKSLDELLSDVEVTDKTSSWILQARLVGESIGGGTISLSKLDSYITQIAKSFFEVAKFKLGAEDKLQKHQAQNFVNNCLFLPTKAGSFISSIEVPYEEIRPKDLITPALTSQEILSNWFSAVNFVNSNVLKGTQNYFMTDAAVHDAIMLFNIPLAESLRKLLTSSAVDQFEFELKTQVGRRVSNTGDLDKFALKRLDDFVKFFRESLIKEDNLTVVGKIFELRSSDPDGNKNHVSIRAYIFGDVAVVSMTLDNLDYQKAIQAHREGRNIRVVGNGVRLRTQTRITQISEFDIA